MFVPFQFQQVLTHSKQALFFKSLLYYISSNHGKVGRNLYQMFVKTKTIFVAIYKVLNVLLLLLSLVNKLVLFESDYTFFYTN